MKLRITPACLFAILVLTFSSCLIGCGGSSKSNAEPTLAVTTTPANGSTQTPAVGPTFPLNVTITSGIPAKGRTISIKATPDGSANAFYTKTVSTTAKSNDFTISGQQVADMNVVSITVTSNSTASNTWTGSYRYSAK